MGRSSYALVWFTLSTALLAAPARLLALETDQFTVPTRPLPDIGPELDAYAAAVVWDVVQGVNARAAAHEREADAATWPVMRSYHRSRAARYRSDDFLARRVYDALAGPGLPECRIEQWVRRHRFRVRRDDPKGRTVFELTLGRCIYGDSLSPFSKPLLLAYISPTVQVHGTYLGVDKLGHVFQHGYHYYFEYRRAESEGLDASRATARAIRIGVAQERGLYGQTTTGVFSNADLAGNYAGLKFFLNLTRPVRIGDATLPALLLRDDAGNLYLNPRRETVGFLKPFIGDHLNEALNPSRFQALLGETVKSKLRRRAGRLLDFYDTTPERERERMVELSTWHGEKYGHCGFGGVVAIADNCPLPRTPAPDSGAVTAGAAAPGSRTAPARLSTR